MGTCGNKISLDKVSCADPKLNNSHPKHCWRCQIFGIRNDEIKLIKVKFTKLEMTVLLI